MKALLTLGVLWLSAIAWAQTPRASSPRPPGDPVDREQRTTVMSVDGDGDRIEGTLQAPDVERIEAGTKVKHPSLIRVREQFDAQRLQSVHEL